MVNLYEGYEQTNYPCQLRIIGRVKCKQNEMTMVWIKKPLRKKKKKGEEMGASNHQEERMGAFLTRRIFWKTSTSVYVSQYFFSSLASSSKVLLYGGSPQPITENLFTEAKDCPWSFWYIPWPLCNPLWSCKHLQVTSCHFYSEASYYYF